MSKAMRVFRDIALQRLGGNISNRTVIRYFF